VIFGETGNDLLAGGGGDDTLDGAEGQNTVRPGTGTNTVQATTTDSILKEGGSDSIKGGSPKVRAIVFGDGLVQRSQVSSFTLQFNRDVSATLDATKVTLRSAGTVIEPSSMALAWDAGSNTAKLTFPGLAEERLPEGQYTLTLAADVKDVSGTPLGQFSHQFSVLFGDATGDGRANDLDLYHVWQNQQKAPAAQDKNADVDGDGFINADDLTLVQNGYLRSTSGTLDGRTQVLTAPTSVQARPAMVIKRPVSGVPSVP